MNQAAALSRLSPPPTLKQDMKTFSFTLHNEFFSLSAKIKFFHRLWPDEKSFDGHFKVSGDGGRGKRNY